MELMYKENDIELMRDNGDKYPQFEFLREWADYCLNTKASKKERLAIFTSIERYGLGEKEPKLRGKHLHWFNTCVRPELDRQHEEIKAHLKAQASEVAKGGMNIFDKNVNWCNVLNELSGMERVSIIAECQDYVFKGIEPSRETIYILFFLIQYQRIMRDEE